MTTRHLTTLALGLLGTITLPAQLVVSNWNITGNTVTFDLAGQIEHGVHLGSNGAPILYIGDPGNTDWITTTSYYEGSITNHGGGSVNLATDLFGYINDDDGDPAPGDFIFLSKENSESWGIFDSIDATVMITGGSLTGSAISPEDLIVSAGFYYTYEAFPNVETQVGYGIASTSAVPEPSTYAVLLGLGSLLFVWSQKRRRSPEPATPAAS